LGGVLLHAQQSTNTASITWASGGDYTVANGGQIQRLKASQQNGGLQVNVNTNEIVQTNAGTFLDITLGSSGALIKVAENTSLVLKNAGTAETGWLFNLVYGRVLVRSSARGSKVFIQAGASVTEAQSGDVNIDFTVMPRTQGQGKPVLAVSAISGSALVTPRASNPGYGRIQVNPGNTLMVDSLMGNTERLALDRTIADYWAKYQTRYIASESGMMTQSASEPSMGGFLVAMPARPDQKGMNLKTAGIITGLVLMLGGVAVQGAMHAMESTYVEKKNADTIFAIGYAPIGLGAFVLVASYLYKSPENELGNIKFDPPNQTMKRMKQEPVIKKLGDGQNMKLK
jgi:hypothetical protein